MSKPIMIYLAGACKNVPDEGREWRERATKMLVQSADWQSSEIKIINPLDFFSYGEQKHKSHKQVKNFYLDKIRHCDVILVNLDNSAESVGTGMEVQCASENRIPIIGFGTQNIYPWISEVDCQVTFDTMTGAIDYIRDYYL